MRRKTKPETDRPTEDEIDNAIDDWHYGAGDGRSLCEYLGWSWDEYTDYVEFGDIPDRPLTLGKD